MNNPAKLTVERRNSETVVHTPRELAELREVRQRFQREKPTLEQVLAATARRKPFRWANTCTCGNCYIPCNSNANAKR